jgi:aminoglycoside phosphotransferase (APT) family kinase protein
VSYLISSINPLLDYLSNANPQDEHVWREWQIKPVGGFHTHPVYHVTNGENGLAVKFAVRGPRDGARREYNALLALQLAGLNIAPKPLLFDHDRLALPVVVMTWVEGEVSDEPPRSEADWLLLARHLSTISRITPQNSGVALQAAVVSLMSASDAVERFNKQVSALPSEAVPSELMQLARRIEALPLPDWPQPRLSLIRGDPNPLNFVRHSDAWLSVDWEDSGWGDPAADMGDLMAHPAYLSVPQSQWDWLGVEYGQMLGDVNASARIRTHRMLSVAWWAASLATRLHHLQTCPDNTQYIGQPPNWGIYLRGRFEQYVALADELLT